MAFEKKKILYIVEAMGGGVFTYIVDMANELANEYDMYIAYQIRPQTPDNYREYFDPRVNLIEVKNFGRQIDPVKDIKAFVEIKKIAKEIQPDIIHLHSSKAGALGRIAFDGKKIPLFYTPHGYSFLMKNHSSKKRAMYKFIEYVCGKRNCTTISCSEGEHKESIKLTKNATYVDNGINMKELKHLIDSIKQDKQDEQPFTVYTLGRICYQKNPKQFNEVALAMPDVRFVWIGDGELRAELYAPNIEITGWVERMDALKYAINADAFLLTSLWEGLPISLLESMYMQKLCIVSNVIGNRDVISNGINGLVCDDTEGFVYALQSIRKDESYRMQMAYNAYCQIEEQYNTKVMAKKYSNIYISSLQKIEDNVIHFCHKLDNKKENVSSLQLNIKKMAE